MVDRDEASFETAAAAVGDLPALLRRLDRGNQLGMLYDVEQAVAEDEAFRERIPDDAVSWDGLTLVVHLEWIGSGTSPADLRQDFYQLLGRFAEDTLFMHARNEPGSVSYEIVTGHIGGDAEHTHHVRFRLTGPRVEFVLSPPRFVPFTGHRTRPDQGQ